MRRWPTALLIVILTLLLAGLSGGCSDARLEVDPAVGDFNASNANDIANEVDSPSWLGAPIGEAQERRHEALTELRASGPEGAELSDLLTEQFPGEIRSAPYYTASGTFDGTSAWFILEVWGSEGGSLDQTRLWVFDRETDHVLYTGAIN